MRILQLVSCRGWSSDAYWAARVSRELERRGHQVTLALKRSADPAVLERARAEGVERIETLDFGSGIQPAADTRDLRRLATAMRAVDIVHVHRGKEHWLAVAAARLGGGAVPIVRTRHIAQAVRPHAGNRWLYGRATALVVTVTEAIRGQYLAADLLPAERVVALPGGADVEAFRLRAPDATVRRRLGGVVDAPLVGIVGGLRVMKGHHVALEAIARLGADGAGPLLAIVGRGSTEPAIRAAIAERRLDARVSVHGWSTDLPAIMAALDVGLYVPLESDGMSRVVFEYLAAGCPLVAARVGVVPEVLTDGEHALLVPGGDAAALAEALRRLLGDASLRARLGAAGRRLVETRYSGARVAERLESHYAGLVA